MSRLGKKPIEIPKNVEIGIEDNTVVVKGPLGEMKREFNNAISIRLEDGFIKVSPVKTRGSTLALWGTYSSLIRNMIEGVINGFTKKLIVEGIGFKSEVSGNKLILSLGFSHPVEMVIPDGIDMKAEKNKIEVFGINKELVGQVAANIRALKKPEPYKGKGIRYEGEIIRRKAGKKSATSA
ncbi:50S ribosomal protein L6 [Patescibacteria group bacterium]|nr:50S ribosomal protein L6 [Patescibacteria group bacterium]MBU2633411.1 50S ribosomal protein L6 [Patescibacteria group bacterium]